MLSGNDAMVLHDHGENDPCNSSCETFAAITAPIPVVHKPWTYFIRLNGMLRQVFPLTYASRENGGTVLIKVSRSEETMVVHQRDLIIDY